MVGSAPLPPTTFPDTVYLDFQATTPLDPAVLDVMLPWLTGAHNPHALEHSIGRRAADAIEAARQSVANLLGCHSSEVTFTSGATEASNIVLRGLIRPDSLLAISSLEHASVAETAHALAKAGARLHRIDVDEDGILDIGHLEDLLDHDLDLVSVTTVNNEIGTVQPVAAAATLCAERRVPLHTDLTQAVGRIPMALADLPIDYGSMSSHKIYGPQGIGALYIRNGAPKPAALFAGGEQESGLRPGTLPVAACVGFGAACDLASSRRQRDACHARTLARAFLQRLAQLDGWLVNGSLDERIPHNLSIAFEGIDADVLLSTTPQLAMATGSACSSGALRRSTTLAAIGLPDPLAQGTVRIGFGRTTTLDEVDFAAATLCSRVTALRNHP